MRVSTVNSLVNRIGITWLLDDFLLVQVAVSDVFFKAF